MVTDAGSFSSRAGAPRDGLSRRDLIKSAAAAGAAAWTAPVIVGSFASPAAAATPPPCPPAQSMNSSGAAAIYQINNAGTVFWTWIPNNGTTCAASPAVPNDDDNWPAAVSRCGGTIRVGNNTMEWNGSAATYQGSPCYFTATATGMKVTAAGITAGVTVLAYVLHNGNIGSCPKISPKGHWMVVCGGLCGDNTGCV